MAPPKKASPGMKQGTLFSFFAKKDLGSAAKTSPSQAAPAQPKNASDKALKATPSKASSSPKKSSAKRTDKIAEPVPNVKVGTYLEVFWPDDDTFYAAIVLEQRGGRYLVQYDTDGQSEWIVLANERWRLVEKKNQPKRRRIVQEDDDDDDEEMEFDDAAADDDDDDDDESVFEDPGNDNDDDEEDNQWLVSDQEDGEEDIVQKKETKKKPSKRVKPTLVVKRDPRSELTPKDKAPSATSFTTPTPRQLSNTVTPPSSSRASPTLGKPLPYTVGAVNPAGSHVHNHLGFMQNLRDAENRPPTHPDYDARTLKIVPSDWTKHNNNKPMTDAVKQWWDLKAQYFDTVLLFKTGKFYEMFHMDADVGVEILDLKYMKGHVAHAGFPEAAYGYNADRLVMAGYKVARVEQTETPDQLAVRKKKHKKGNGPAPKVVNREVCSILSLGTRTFCYLDDCKFLDIDESANHTSNTGPLLVIREVEYAQEENTNNDDNCASAACEYGVTLVDAIRGTVTMGQFADDNLRSRMQTLLASFSPCEIILQGGAEKASATLETLVKTYQRMAQHPCRLEIIRTTESSPRSTALDPIVRKQLERAQKQAQPWDTAETLDELHRRQYYPKASKQDPSDRSIGRWPPVIQAVVEGQANLALSSFGAAVYYLQRNLIDGELLSLGIVKAYVPPSSTVVPKETNATRVEQIADAQEMAEAGVTDGQTLPSTNAGMDWSTTVSEKSMADVSHMSLDGTTLHNLEILYNTADGSVQGSLWSKINHCKTPHGARLLRAWLLRPLFRKTDIDRRAEAVEELVSGGAAVALNEARQLLKKCGDIERLLSRVHSMSGTAADGELQEGGVHPNERAVLYEQAKYTRRKVGDFSKVLNGLREASKIPDVFADFEVHSGLLAKIVKRQDQGGRFPDVGAEVDWFFENFDCEKAASGQFEPIRGIDSLFDESLDTIEQIGSDLKHYQKEMSAELGGVARSTWKYINVKPESKDKYLIELPASVRVPPDFVLKAKRGTGAKQINKYRTHEVAELVEQLERAYDILAERKARGMQLIFAKFDSLRHLWALVGHTTAMLDALGSLAITSSKPGHTRPTILECPEGGNPSVCVSQGRHPCIENTPNSEFVPNDLSLGTEAKPSRVLLLSGPNMGGKSTLLRQTCLISILAQIGCFVPSEDCKLTPIDRIFTRLGASDRILLGQSTFFVELAETAAALRGATRRSLVIMDELGRGTSTFDGTAIASATVKHLVERSQCLTLFATHYHSLLDEWKTHPMVRLGHMECMVEDADETMQTDEEDTKSQRITFLYTLGEGVCPKSFGINVARLAGLPEAVLKNAQRISTEFEEEVSSGGLRVKTAPSAAVLKQKIEKALAANDWDALSSLWQQLKSQCS